MAKCRSAKRHFAEHPAAMRRLREIQDHPTTTADGAVRMYAPVGVTTCHCGGFVLTSNGSRQFSSGKKSRRGRASTRRR